MTGIGGDCFVLFTKPGSDDIHALNGSGRAPAAASAADLRARSLDTVPLHGPEAVTIPGAVDAFCHLSDTHGKLGLDALLAPAIHYAENGVPVAPRVANDWPSAGECLQGHGLTHFSNGGKPLQQGEIFRCPGQAEVLRRVARDGRDAFYKGEVADDILAALNAMGGVHTADDFAATACTPTDPISGSYSGIDLVEHPPNGQGATAILLLNILTQFDIAAMDPLGAQRAHIEAEATKLAYDARNRFMADSDHVARLGHMLSMDTARALAALIDPKKAMPSATTLSEAVHRDTIYITVVDRDRMAVSLIYSIFHGFGSGIASEKFGILLQNRGAGFTLEEGHPNEMAGGKRPMHTIIPGMLREGGRVTMPFGVMGGAYQANGHARFVSNLRDFGFSSQEAIDAPAASPMRASCGSRRVTPPRCIRRWPIWVTTSSNPTRPSAARRPSKSRKTACSKAALTRARTAARWGIDAATSPGRGTAPQGLSSVGSEAGTDHPRTDRTGPGYPDAPRARPSNRRSGSVR